jgi:hypothetical protein
VRLPSASPFLFPCPSSLRFDELIQRLIPSQHLINAETGCAVKGGGPQRELNPSGNWFAPPGSNQSGSGGNETAEAFGAESR